VRFAPSTCHCIVDIPNDPYNELKAEFVQRCKTHSKPNVTFIHNRLFSNQPELAILEKLKPQFAKDKSFKP